MEKSKKIEKRKKPKKEEYVLKKNTAMKALRIILWVMLGFFFLKGVIVTIRPDQSVEVTQMIKAFKEEFSSYKNENEEILSFAQNFTKEYLTYQIRDEAGYKARLKPYISDSVYNLAGDISLSATAKAAYTNAYRKEQYSDTQYDVYVLAEVEYEIRVLSSDQKTFDTNTVIEQTTLKVPVRKEGSKYVVEDLPVFVTDGMKAEGVSVEEYSGTSLSDAYTKAVKESLQNFFKAYCEQDKSVIEYYLTKDADRSRFQGLNGRYLFQSIEKLKCYQEPGSADIICLVGYKVKDSINDVVIYQELNLIVREDGGKYYVKEMNTRTRNIQVK